ncbi:caspase family protein [Prosthecobacter dejongeii]|uniref:Tetratricopeptide (TPR) repeat protein n=1 Tax=Prosthecobacter dejongeii TaxID=48465 RepID=A0A7W7YKF2_9BACT|nr:caspase family protein [Prosthecobacter dejongeii]MBB5037843.1 tetratricopeptide (TPR) repeat protein [Prosthecobacter dejongeii]
MPRPLRMNLWIHLFLGLCLLSLPLQAATEAKIRTALVIGNARYEPLVGPLRNTTNDAKAVAKTLRDLGFAVIEKHNVTRDQLLKAVLEFRGTLAGAEVALFYFAGHGIAVAGSNYLIPLKSGYNPEGADDISLRLLAETRLFNVEQAVADMSTAGAQCNLVILDACRTTALSRTGRTRDATAPGGLNEMKPPAGSLIAFATDAGQTALDGDGANGLYTEEWLKHLSTPGLTIEQVFKRTRAGVLERSQGGQIPAEYSRLVGDDIYIAGPSASPAAVMSAATPAIPSQTQILNLAKAGMAEECADSLLSVAKAQGPGAYAAEPLGLLLEQAKENLKDATTGDPKVEAAATTCLQVLRALPHCLPATHESYQAFQAKAHNRHGDALLLLDQETEAIAAFDTALALDPTDAYILYNRGRAHAAVGDDEKARADFTAASNPKFNQPKARKLAEEALEKLK